MGKIEDELSTYIHLSKYARWIEKENRRETWDETVDRLINYWFNKYPSLGIEIFMELREAIYKREVMPSMRSLMTAGPALDRDNAAAFNCAAIAVNHPRVFDEIFYLLMNGCGVGFSVERKYINKLPTISEEFHHTDSVIKVKDSKIGWAKALKELIALLYNGDIPTWDLSEVRPAGARLKIFGGRASGPLPLDRLLKYTCRAFKGAAGRQLTTIECHDLICKIAETVIVGSVRRSACISLSNLSDDRMRRAKTGAWWETNPERALANISVAYTEKPDMESFTKEFRNLYQSKAGERGIINKNALRRKAEECGREYEGEYLLNPCGEAILRDSGGFCCLSEVVIRPYDTLEDLKKKVRYATILGTLQVSLSNFRYLRKVWTTNQEEERLIGVSLTGIMDHEVMCGSIMEFVEEVDADSRTITSYPHREAVISWLKELKQVAKETNEEWAARLGINPSKQLSLIKPSGTVSQLCNTSSGIHPRYSKYYIRRVRQDIKDPLTDLMIDEGIPYVVQGEKAIFSFPVKSPEGSITNSDLDALDQLNLWKIYRDHWCEGNPSQTIYYNDNTFLKVQDWVWDNWSSIGGLSFFPTDDNIYENAPYESISEEKYEELISSFPTALNWSRLNEFEKEDNTGMETEFACSGGNCELV